jgi:hypothetical protein
MITFDTLFTSLFYILKILKSVMALNATVARRRNTPGYLHVKARITKNEEKDLVFP